jgi:hypothetical protein
VCVVERVVPSAGDPVLAPAAIPEVLKLGLVIVQFGDATHHEQQVDDRLGEQARNGRRADVMSHGDEAVEGVHQPPHSWDA